MGILDLFGSRPARTELWTHSPGDIVWRMIPTREGVLVGENRSEAEKTVRFFGVDIRTGAVLWKDLRFEEAWWLGVEAASEGVAYLHEFARPDMPEHTGVIALDVRTGEVLWRRKDLTLALAAGGTAWVFSPMDPTAVFGLDGRTGKEIGGPALAPGELRERKERSTPEAEGGYRMPDPLSNEDSLWPVFRTLTARTDVVGEPEALVVDEASIFSYHVRRDERDTGGTLVHRIEVTDGKGRRVYTTVAHAEAHTPVADAFFVFDRILCFVRDERTIVAVGLP